jgi:hypothetical protein
MNLPLTTQDVANIPKNTVNFIVNNFTVLFVLCVSQINTEIMFFCYIQEKMCSITQDLQKDLEDPETRIYPRYEVMAPDVQAENTGH